MNALSYDRETEAAMGNKVKNYQIVYDWCAGKLLIRLGLGRRVSGLHLPSPPLSRRDVRALRLSVRGQAAIPDRIDAWWMGLDEADRVQLEAGLRALSWLAWVSLWWHAGDGIDPEDDDGVTTLDGAHVAPVTSAPALPRPR